MSKVGRYLTNTGIPIVTLTGNVGGPIPSDAGGNFNILGADPITTTGNFGTNTITISVATATTAQIGVTTLATNAETIGGVVNNHAVVPSGLTAKLGVQTLFGVPYGNTTAGAIQWTVPGNNGQVLIGSTAAAPAFATLASAGGTIVFTPGPNSLNLETAGAVPISFPTDAGTATPAVGILNVLTQHATLGCGSSVSFSAPGPSNTVQLNVTDARNNTFIGNNAGNLTLTSNFCVALGYYAGASLTSGVNNTFIGSAAGTAVTGGSSCTAVGEAALNVFTTAPAGVGSNTAIGTIALASLTTGAYNTAVCSGGGSSLLTGSNNTLLGWSASASGTQYFGAESSNVLLVNVGVTGESNTMRLGTHGNGVGQQNRCYVAGIANVDVGNVATVVSIDTGDNQLGTTTITAGAGITVTGGAGTITIAAHAAFAWTVETVNMNMVVNHGYIANKVGTLELTLPAVSAVGDIVRVAGMNTALGWQIKQNAGNTIYFNGATTTPGAGGTLTSSAIHDAVELICRTVNADWQVISNEGNPTPA